VGGCFHDRQGVLVLVAAGSHVCLDEFGGPLEVAQFHQSEFDRFVAALL
jgi:hypothetical protein